ncbi:hypothetical protein [Listeria sp. SHR_NRA_18]|nr:hypothetical protein [Listeria sp. SHR_NRA_18]
MNPKDQEAAIRLRDIAKEYSLKDTSAEMKQVLSQIIITVDKYAHSK